MSHDPSADQHFEFTPDMTPAEIHKAKEDTLESKFEELRPDVAAVQAKAEAERAVTIALLDGTRDAGIQVEQQLVETLNQDLGIPTNRLVEFPLRNGYSWFAPTHHEDPRTLPDLNIPQRKGFNFSPSYTRQTEPFNTEPFDIPFEDVDIVRGLPERDWSEGVPQFVEDLEGAIDGFLKDQPALDSANTASEIAAELLKHPALHGYLDSGVGELARLRHIPDCDYMHDGDVDLSDFVQDDPEAAHMDQWQRYAEQGENMQGMIHFGVDWNGHVPHPNPGVQDYVDAVAKASGEDISEDAAALPVQTEQEFLGNVVPERWERRRPQLMAQARAGIAALQELAGMAAEHKGFHEDRPHSGAELTNWQGNKLMLIVSEAVEAHDEIRTGHSAYETYYPDFKEVSDEKVLYKPEGVPSEIADVVIRSADFAWTEGFDLADIIIEKLEFNATRGYKHGKQF